MSTLYGRGTVVLIAHLLMYVLDIINIQICGPVYITYSKTIISFIKNQNHVDLSDMFVTELTLNPPEGIVAGPVNEENFFEWEALITFVIFIIIYYIISVLK